MSCPHERELLEMGSVPIAHLEACQHCRETLALLGRARVALRALPADRDELALRRLWRATEARLEAQRPSRAWIPLALAAAATVLILALRPTHQPAPAVGGLLVEGQARAAGPSLSAGAPLPGGERLRIAARARFLAGGARVVTGTETALELGSTLEPGVLILEEGLLAVAVDPQDPPFALRTTQARLRVVSGIFRLRATAGQTEVSVDAGEVELTVGEHGPRSVLRAGESRRLPEPRTVPAPAPELTPVQAAPPAVPVARTEPVRARTAEPRPLSPAPIAPPAAELTPAIPSPPPTVARARAALGSDAREARAIADAVLATKPPPRIEVEALMIGGDAARRSGDLAGALGLFSRVAEHREAGAFGEEATLRAARIEHELGDPARAERRLNTARAQYAGGTLWPEREALSARLLRERDELAEAQRLLAGLPAHLNSAPLVDERLALASALIAAARPAEARALLLPLDDPTLPDSVRARARALLATAP